MSNPMTSIYLCSNVYLNNDYHHTVWFDSLTDQLNYFSNKVTKTLNQYTYVRKSWSLKVDATMEEARTWTYLYFRNGTGKYYFYFINNVEYVNDNTVELSVEIDVMQTYAFDYNLSQCFVDREHSATDEIGDNLIDEGLDLGEMVDISKQNIDMQNLCIVIVSTVDLTRTTENFHPVFSHVIDGVYSGLTICACDLDHYTAFRDLLYNLEEWGISDCIFSMFMYPKNLLTINSTHSWANGVVQVEGSTQLSTLISRPSSLYNNFYPKNKKLYTYPYNYLYVSNNNGGSSLYRYEYFNDPSQCQLRVYGSVTAEGNTKLIPINYKGTVINYEEGIIGSPYPTCAWNSDPYKLWLAQNQNSQKLGLLTSGASIVGGAITSFMGAPMIGVGMMSGGVMGISQQLAQKKDMDAQPPQAKGSQSSAINVKTEHQTYTLIRKCVDETRAKILDEYFSMFGYKTLRVKVPNRKVRENYTYTKTQNCHVYGNLCTDDLRKIQSIFDNGITFWVNGDLIGRYGVSNNCL